MSLRHVAPLKKDGDASPRIERGDSVSSSSTGSTPYKKIPGEKSAGFPVLFSTTSTVVSHVFVRKNVLLLISFSSAIFFIILFRETLMEMLKDNTYRFNEVLLWSFYTDSIESNTRLQSGVHLMNPGDDLEADRLRFASGASGLLDQREGKSSCPWPGLPLTPPLQVYMYDLPEKFNFGMVKQFAKTRGLSIANATYPAHQHSGEWWLYSDLTKTASSRTSGCPPAAVRVTNVEQADVFFVPVFSSLSLIVNPLSKQRKHQLDPDAHNDQRMQEELMDWLEAQEPWRKSKGRDHVIPAQDPNSMWAVVRRTKKAILLVSDFGRLKAEEGSLLKDVVMPYVHRVGSLTEKEERVEGLGPKNRTTLLFFMGNRYRKDGGAVRNTLFKVLQEEPDMMLKEGLQSIEGRRASKGARGSSHAESASTVDALSAGQKKGRLGMKTSKFCLHPAGDTPSACRMFDAITNLCVPVVVSDQIELPFEDVLDYSRFAIFVPTSKAIEPRYMGELLRSREVQERLPGMQAELRRVRHLFEWEVEDGVVPQVWRKVAMKLPWVREMMNRDRRIVRGGPRQCAWRCRVASLVQKRRSKKSTSKLQTP